MRNKHRKDQEWSAVERAAPEWILISDLLLMLLEKSAL